MQTETGIYPAITEEEKETVFKLRYEVYVAELGRYSSIADHDRRMLQEDVDANSRLFYAVMDGKPVAGMRITFGGDGPFSERHINQYQLGPFLARGEAEKMIVGERLHVCPDYRGTDILFRMFTQSLNFVKEHNVEMLFGDCEPHLLNLYLGLGFRTYSKNNFNSPEAGYLILMMMLPKDTYYLESIGSPLLPFLADYGGDHAGVEWHDVFAEGSAISQKLAEPEEYWSHVYGALDQLEAHRINPFDGLSDEQTDVCMDKSAVIECAEGDRILKKGNSARNMFIVLSGVLEVRDGDQVIAAFTTGDVFGEMAFLLGLPRTQDVYAATADVKLLSLSEGQIRGIIDSHPDIAAKLMLNISKMLCTRLLRQ